jgi:hypothetical protein
VGCYINGDLDLLDIYATAGIGDPTQRYHAQSGLFNSVDISMI